MKAITITIIQNQNWVITPVRTKIILRTNTMTKIIAKGFEFIF